MSSRPIRLLAIGAALAQARASPPRRPHQGLIIHPHRGNAVQPGVDNRASVVQTLGKPTFTSQFGGGDWYYVARDTHNLAFRTPKAENQLTLQISFDRAGTGTAIRRGGLDQVAAIDPYGKTTPTLGKKRGFFEDLFGNIGAVGAGGAGGGGGGDRDTP